MSESFPKLRSDLIVTSESGGEQPMYTVKDPLSNRFFRLRAPEHYLLTRADGKTSPEAAATLTSQRFGIVINAESAAAFFAKMERLLFFEGTALERELPRLRHMTSAGQRRSIGTIRLKAFNPDLLLSRWIRRVRPVFTPAGIGVAIVLMVLATVVALGQRGIGAATLAHLWRLSSIPVLFAAVVLIGFVHEFGHALTLKYYGGSVREMGFLLLYFQPCFYCNLSDSYLLPQRRARVFVGFAGLFFQGVLTAFLILMWRIAAPGTLPANFFYVATAFSLGLFLFNLNPMIRLDGYFILADWLRIPNLRSKAMQYWRNLIGEWVAGRAHTAQNITPRLTRIFRWYGVAALIYTGLLLGWILYHIVRLVNGRWGIAGNMLLLAIIVGWAVQSRESGSETSRETEGAKDTGVRVRKWRKPAVFWGSLIVLVVLLAVIRAERHVGSVCRVDPSARYTISAPSREAIESELFVGQTERREKSVLQAGSSEFSAIQYALRVKEGDVVHTGDTLLVLSCNRYQADLADAESQRERIIAERNLLLSGPKKDQVKGLRAEIAEIVAQLNNKRTEVQRSQQLMQRSLIAKDAYESIKTEQAVLQARLDAKRSALALMISNPKAEELAIKEAQITGLDSQIAFLRSQIEASTLRTPIDGTATLVDRGGVLAEVSDLDPVRVQLAVSEDDIADVRVDSPVSLKVRALPFDEFHGRVTYVASNADTLSGKREFAVLTEIENPHLMLKPGMSGYSKISCGRSSLLSLISRRAVHFIRVEFWSWW